MNAVKSVLFFSLFLLCIPAGEAFAHSIPGPDTDKHNTVYSYNISEVSLDSNKKLHVTVTVHMCPACSPYNNYVKVTVGGIGTQTTTNTPVGTTCTRSFTFDASGLKVGDIVRIDSDVWCEWCGHWYDSQTYKVEERICEIPGLGESCEMTLVRIGSSVNVANGNLYDSFQVSPDKRIPLALGYNSRSTRQGRFGFGWNDSYDTRLIAKKDGSVVLVETDGQEQLFTPNGDGSFKSPPGNHDSLSLNSGVIFSDNMENGAGSWIADSPWGQTTSDYHSAGTSWTDSPTGNYANSSHTALNMPLDLSGAKKATLNFWHKYFLESGYDFGYVEISKDGGSNWSLVGNYTGELNSWTEQSIDLSAYAGKSGLLLRFRLITDSNDTMDGWYIDDVTVSAGTGYILRRKNGETVRFDKVGNPAVFEDRNGNKVYYSWQGEVPVSLTDADGRTLLFTSDAQGRITAITDNTGRTSSFSYDGEGNLVSIGNSAGKGWLFSYDAGHNMVRKTDPMGNTSSYSFDGQDRLVGAVDPLGKTRTVIYETEGTTAFIDSAGARTEFTHNGGLQVSRKTDAQGNVTEYGWDSDLNRTSVSDASGTVRNTYDGAGNLLSSTDQSGQITAYTYDGQGNLLTRTAPDGSVTTSTYDEKGNLLSTRDPLGNTTSYRYDGRGRMIGSIDPMGRETGFAYDDSGYLAAITDPVGAVIRFTYDQSGNMISRTDASGAVTRFEYDILGRLIRTIDPLGNITVVAYDDNGARISETDANGNTTKYEYNAKGQLIKATDALGDITVYGYGESGCASCGGADKLATITDANGNTTTFNYDSLGRLVNETDPLGNITAYAYDSKGNLATKTDANGNIIKYTYDSLGRLLIKIYPDGTEESFTYSANGNILTAANKNISYGFTYDAAGKVLSVTDSEGRVIQYDYDFAGRKTKLAYPNGSVVSFGYDEAGRPSTITNGGGKTFSLAYDKAGRRTKLSYPNGATADYSYDTAGRLTGLVHRKMFGPVIDSFIYTHDKVGNRLSKAEPEGKTSYGYDKIYRLTSAQPDMPWNKAEEYAYDPVGNRLSGPWKKIDYQYNQGNQLTEKSWQLPGLLPEILKLIIPCRAKNGKTEYIYDKNGNLIQKTEPAGPFHFKSITLYTYDFENRLIKVETQRGREANVVSFTYDPFGRRLSKTVHREEIDDDDTGCRHDHHLPKTLFYVYDNEDIILEYDERGRVESRYVHGPGTDEPLALYRQGEAYYYHADGLGSVTALTDGHGRVVRKYEYDSFGNMRQHPGYIDQPYTYTGREWDKETGLYYYRARYYDPMQGRFITKDPIGFAGGDVNLYGYVQNNVINLIDPQGLKNCPPNVKRYVEDFLSGLKEVAKKTNINVDLLIALSSHESGWANAHNRSLHNLWGLTRAGGRNLSFESFEAGNNYWASTWGERLCGSQDINTFTNKLVDGSPKYNNFPGYKEKIATQYRYWLRIKKDCICSN